MTAPTLAQLQAAADAISKQSPAIRNFAEMTVAYLKGQAPAPPPPQAGTRWYGDRYPYNIPIPSSPPIHPDNATIIANTFVPSGSPLQYYNQYWLGPRDAWLGSGGAAPGVVIAPAGTPLATVELHYDDNVTFSCTSGFRTMQVPIPSTFDVGPINVAENKIVVFDPSGSGEWEFFDMSPPGVPTFDYAVESGGAIGVCNNPPAGDGHWHCLNGRHFPEGGFNSNSIITSGTWADSGIYFGAGAIRMRDILNTSTGGSWDHALGLDFASNSNGGTYPSYTFPAIAGDGRFAGGPPMGARFQLDPSINIDTWPSLSGKPEWLKQMCRTMQVYGLISQHSAERAANGGQGNGDGIDCEWYKSAAQGSGFVFPWQNPDGTLRYSNGYDPNMNVPPDLLPHFRVIDWTKWTGA